MTMNPDKCNYMCQGKNSNVNETLFFNECNHLKTSNEETILGITTNRKLVINSHITTIKDCFKDIKLTLSK